MSWRWTFHHVGRQMRGHPRVVVATAAAFCLLTLVVGVARLGDGVVRRWGAFVGQNVHVIAYLGEDVDQEQAVGLATILARSPTVARVRVVEPEQALARLGAMALSLASDARPLEGLEPDYFPRSLEVSLVPAADLGRQAQDLAKRLKSVPGVLEVDAMTAGLARLAVWIKLGRAIGIGMLVALGLVALLALVTVFLRSRATVAERAAVLAQLGETPAAIRLPAGLWTALAALAGGAVGALLLTVAWPFALGRLEANLGVASPQPVPALGATEIAIGLGLLALGGLLMGYLATPLCTADDHA